MNDRPDDDIINDPSHFRLCGLCRRVWQAVYRDLPAPVMSPGLVQGPLYAVWWSLSTAGRLRAAGCHWTSTGPKKKLQQLPASSPVEQPPGRPAASNNTSLTTHPAGASLYSATRLQLPLPCIFTSQRTPAVSTHISQQGTPLHDVFRRPDPHYHCPQGG